ncbi:MAG: hypothetical protein ACOZE5_14505 [Verrucomicrobiota bacterium]
MNTFSSWRAAALLSAAAFALSARAGDPAIALSVETEDGQKMLIATVTQDEKPVENAKVAFFARRTFGALALGAEVTLDDGTAAVPFPTTLPGDTAGWLQLGAELANRPKDAPPVRAESRFEGGVPFRAEPQAPPRALWSSRAPVILLVNIALLAGLVWGAFAYAVLQLLRIRSAPDAGATPAFAQPKNTP